jgi:hypothetical protein
MEAKRPADTAKFGKTYNNSIFVGAWVGAVILAVWNDSKTLSSSLGKKSVILQILESKARDDASQNKPRDNATHENSWINSDGLGCLDQQR